MLDFTRVGAGTGNDEGRLVFAGQLGHLVEVDAVIVFPDAVVNRVVQLPRKVQVHAVRQVSAVRQVHRQERVARLEYRHVDRHVGLRAGMRLDVGMLGSEELAGTVAGERLGNVDELTAAIVPPTGIAFGVLVRQDGAGSLQDRGTGVILGGDQLQPVGLASLFLLDNVPDFGIGRGQGRRGGEVGGHHGTPASLHWADHVL